MTHDYHPEWDHDVLDTPQDAAGPMAVVLERVRSQILPEMGLQDIRIFFARLDGPVGLYVDGTSSLPVIGIDHEALSMACSIHGLDYGQQLAATIAHELGHAYQETLGVDDPDEESVEDFARSWVLEDRVDLSTLHPSEDKSCSC